MSVETTTQVGCHYLRTSVGKFSKGVQKEVESWLRDNGPEWVTRRVKALWNASLHLKNGEPEKARECYQGTSIAYHRDSLLPKGNWGLVVRRFVQAKRPQVIRRYAGVLRWYTALRLKELSNQQRAKALNSISGPRKEGVTFFGLNSLSVESRMIEALRNRYNRVVYELSQSLRTVTALPGGFTQENMSEETAVRKARSILRKRFSPILDYDISKLSGTSYYFGEGDCPLGLKVLPYGQMVHSLITNDIEVVPDHTLTEKIPLPISTEDEELLDLLEANLPIHTGRIAVLQEQGCKARVVFQPSVRVQYSAYPYHKVLSKLSEELFPRESCTFDQTKGIYAVLELLERGGQVFSVDLSSATDRFPYETSKKVILDNDLFPQFARYGKLVDAVIRYGASCSFTDTGSIKYAVGQPMGLYGSFPLFHLSNLLVAESAHELAIGSGKSVTRFSDGSTYKVLGDDIILSDGLVAEIYKCFMQTLGVDISETKTFSGKVAEFAGFIAVPTRNGRYHAFRPYKVPDRHDLTNPLQFLHALGSNVTKLSHYWEVRYDAYIRTLGQRDLTLSPLVRDDDTETVYHQQGSSQWINALVNRYFMSTERKLSDWVQRELDPISAPFHERGAEGKPYEPDEYVVYDKRRKRAKRGYSDQLRSDPLIQQVLKERAYRRASKPSDCPTR